MHTLDRSELDELVRRALAEDLGDAGDITTKRIIRIDQPGKGRIVCKQAGILAGRPVADAVFNAVDRSLVIEWLAEEGSEILPGTDLALLHGRARAIFAAERVALNFLQHLSGVATVTSKYAEPCLKYGVKLLCTRKTLPGLRTVERYAVAVGGGQMHRAGLFDAILIKSNHSKLAGSLGEAVRRTKANPNLSAEVEVSDMEGLEEAIEAGADSILLDNAGLDLIKKVVARTRGNIYLEVSGGVSLKNIAAIARLKPDAISVGALTHSAPSIDLALHMFT
ncbi:MAG: carboxylating nicotinate-nucleotide diphosphorylase [Actinomycetota bacterium]